MRNLAVENKKLKQMSATLFWESEHEHCCQMIGYAAETETVLTKADIDENFANKADWIHQIEEVRHKNGQGWVPRSAAGCRPEAWRKLVKRLSGEQLKPRISPKAT